MGEVLLALWEAPFVKFLLGVLLLMVLVAAWEKRA